MSNIFQGLREADDIAQAAAAQAAPAQPVAEPEATLNSSSKKVNLDYQDSEGSAPNGEQFNKVLIINADSKDSADSELRKFKEINKGVKKVVDTKEETSTSNGPAKITVYYVDNHKYGMWTPFHGQKATGDSSDITEGSDGISAEALADILYSRLKMRYPDIISKFNYNVVDDIVNDVASFHAGAEELGSSDMGIMIREILTKLDNIQVDESAEDAYGDEYQSKVQSIGQKAKQAQVLKAKGKEPRTRWNPVTKKYYVDFSDPDEKKVSEARDSCHVCGQTPCNCTHIAEDAEPVSSQEYLEVKTFVDAMTPEDKQKVIAALKTNLGTLEEDLSRRGFLRGIGAAATGAALAGAGANAMAGQSDPDSIKGLSAEEATYKLAYRQALNAHPNPNSAMAKMNAQRVAQAAAKAAAGDGTYSQGKLVRPAQQSEPTQRVQPTQQQAQPSARRAGGGMMEGHEKCPHCGGEMVNEELMNEKKDACYYKVKSRYKVWPSAYASGALVKCRKKGASNWGTKSESSILEGLEQVDENLHQWFKEKWVRFGPDGKIRGDCARGDDSEGKPKCLPQSKAQNLGKEGRASAASRKRREDPNPERSGKAINVKTKKKSNEEVAEDQLDELSCWSGYTRVQGIPAGAPGSCKKKTKG